MSGSCDRIRRLHVQPEGRRANNAQRADALEAAAKACGVALAFITIELVLAFVAVAVQ